MHSFSVTRSNIGWIIALIAMGPFSASQAQVTIPDIPFRPQGLSTQPLGPSEAAYHVDEAGDRRGSAVSVRGAYPVDTIQAAITDAGKTWLARIQAPIEGIEQDPAIRVLVAANEITRAQSLISDRIAKGRLPTDAKALTYLTAVGAFANQVFPERLPIAESYLVKLDALGDSAVTRQFQARMQLIHVYFLLGRSADIRRLGASMIPLAAKMPFNDRKIVFSVGGLETYRQYVDALTSEPNAAEVIAKTNAILESAAKTPPEWVARDEFYLFDGMRYQADLADQQAKVAPLGKPAQPLVAHRWINRPGNDSLLRFGDGKIHVIELANTSCMGCMMALQMIQRLRTTFPNVETAFATYTYGFWGNRYVSADEETELIIKFLNERAKVTMPAGIWKSSMVTNEDGGRSIENPGPNYDHYPTTKMSVWVIDGRGIIRRSFDDLPRESEAELFRTVNFLEREAAEAKAAATRTTP